MSHPAGLSTESLVPNPASSSSPPATREEHWSDAHDTLDSDTERDAIEEAGESGEDLTIPPKLSSDKTETHEIVDTPSPTRAQAAPERVSDADATSVHSMPLVQVTEPTSPILPATPRSVNSHHSSTTARSQTSLAPPSASASATDRRRRNRNTLDPRASNRFSGFLSNLIHRRDQPSSPSAPAPAEPQPPSVSSTNQSRASSPVPPRPSTPPPPLPSPSLDDLGLSLSPLTIHLAPSHFSSPPISGAFLAPHYLLLCHAQGLDALPLISPPAPQPYALVRRAPFKSIVVMEHRGVLVAIAGRRDGVRVYALEEIRRMIEWRMEVEVRREREKAKREETKRAVTAITLLHHDGHEKRGSTEKQPAIVQAAPPEKKPMQPRRASVSSALRPGAPRAPVIRSAKSKTPQIREDPPPDEPAGPPPAYSGSPIREITSVPPIPPIPPVPPPIVPPPRTREALAGTMSRRHTLTNVNTQAHEDGPLEDDSKNDWASSDDEAINVMTAPSGSQALDERTSAMANGASTAAAASASAARAEMTRAQTAPSLSSRPSRRGRPANLDLSIPPPSPTPTLLTLRQALTLGSAPRQDDGMMSPDVDGDADGISTPATPTRERISLAEALFESRLPELPPEPILINSQNQPEGDLPASPRTSEPSTSGETGSNAQNNRRRRRWSVLGGVFSNSSGQSQSSIPSLAELAQAPPPPPVTSTPLLERRASLLTRSQSGRIATSTSTSTVTPRRPTTSPGPTTTPPTQTQTQDIPPVPQPPSAGTSHSRFLPRLLTQALGRRSDDVPSLPRRSGTANERLINVPNPPHAPAPKLEYVKLPGTKGAVTVKAVETGKKSFLAILCGDNGEKVELFAGTYRTALGLSRTFILPDSPRSLELQLQGDDLVEVFLVFSQNVFGLEPATVRVREVRIGRAERRAARRRARENMPASAGGGDGDTDPGVPNTEEEVTVNVTAPTEGGTPGTVPSTDELITLAAAQMSPYTTFQQLSFAPNFPLATIADEYIIPPTYRSFIEYRSQYEPEVDGTANVDLSQVQFSPPGLPVPTPAPPSRWFYRDPKALFMVSPWKASLMQAWYRDGLLPPDLPVRREEDADYTLLKDLRLQCVDPTHPFRSSPPVAAVPAVPTPDSSKPLLSPQSLLSQPKHFGPPALFYSSRGGHSTTIVDSRGRSVLKGRFMWSTDEAEGSPASGRLGDVKRLEAFDVKDRAVLVAMRQGGLEVVDFGDALLKPADHSRTSLPHFHPPLSSMNRRGPFVWKIGTPKQSIGPSKSPGRAEFILSNEGNDENVDEVFFLGRKEDEMFLCERTAPHSGY
ncbi:uncharacterized protein BXZ73DRAFT_87377 [Epithele typhae]|uniref:uncharacterized protein n=1 Tax=Epithele typhae TaxID=378194 RepID=UPI0020079C98|nr:uncharacterized protein BXZ73DRAFT_87377 [Epithele typhae]KAH9944494.1 hypothetical protein BXZ73DRAFT_87377 [Epithele typhae]